MLGVSRRILSGVGIVLMAIFVFIGYAAGDSVSARQQAEQVLTRYFELIHESNFRAVIDLYGGSYGVLRDWNPGVEDKVELWKRGCTVNGLQPLLVKRIVATTRQNDGSFLFDVEFRGEGDRAWLRGPCCGESGPPDSVFTYEVYPAQTGYLVRGLPPYLP